MLKNVADLCHTVVVNKSFSSFHELDTGLVKSDVTVLCIGLLVLLHMVSAQLYITMWFSLMYLFFSIITFI